MGGDNGTAPENGEVSPAGSNSDDKTAAAFLRRKTGGSDTESLDEDLDAVTAAQQFLKAARHVAPNVSFSAEPQFDVRKTLRREAEKVLAERQIISDTYAASHADPERWELCFQIAMNKMIMMAPAASASATKMSLKQEVDKGQELGNHSTCVKRNDADFEGSATPKN